MIYRTVICIFIVNVFIGVNIEIVKSKLLRCLSVDNKKKHTYTIDRHSSYESSVHNMKIKIYVYLKPSLIK